MSASDITIQYSIDGSSPIALRLPGNRVVVGSSSQADLRVESPFLSRRHFVIEYQDGRLYITDLGSSNGTMLQGRRLPPEARQEWRPGEVVDVANLRFEYFAPQVATGPQAVPLAGAGLTMTFDRESMSPGQHATAVLSYHGNVPQTVYLRSDTSTDGLNVYVEPMQAIINPGQTINADIQVEKTGSYWTGGSFPVTVVAVTDQGLNTLAEIMVRVRPRYGLLLLPLLLLLGVGAVAGLPQLLTTTAPIATETATITPTFTATATEQAATDTPTATEQTPTGTPTVTPSPTVTPTPTNTHIPTSTRIPTREATNTPVVVTVIVPQPPIIIFPPPIIVTPTPTNTPVVSCAGFLPTSPLDGLPNGPATFYWDPPTSGGAIGYTLTVTNNDNGRQVRGSTAGNVTTITLDISGRTLGDGISFTWLVTAQLNNGRTCPGQPVTLLREFPPGYGVPPAGQQDVTPDTRPPVQINGLLPDVFASLRDGQTQAVQDTLDSVGDLMLLLFIGGVIGYEWRRKLRRPRE